MASYYSPSIEKLIEAFQKLPSIGEKSAVRLAFYILNSSEEETNKFIQSIQEAKKTMNVLVGNIRDYVIKMLFVIAVA